MVERQTETESRVFGSRRADLVVFLLLLIALLAASPRLAVYWRAPQETVVPQPAALDFKEREPGAQN